MSHGSAAVRFPHPDPQSPAASFQPTSNAAGTDETPDPRSTRLLGSAAALKVYTQSGDPDPGEAVRSRKAVGGHGLAAQRSDER